MGNTCKWCSVGFQDGKNWTYNRKMIYEKFCSRKCFTEYLNNGGTVSYVKYKWTLLIIGVIVTEILLRYYTDYSLIPIFKAIVIFIIDTIRSILN